MSHQHSSLQKGRFDEVSSARLSLLKDAFRKRWSRGERSEEDMISYEGALTKSTFDLSTPCKIGITPSIDVQCGSLRRISHSCATGRVSLTLKKKFSSDESLGNCNCVSFWQRRTNQTLRKVSIKKSAGKEPHVSLQAAAPSRDAPGAHRKPLKRTMQRCSLKSSNFLDLCRVASVFCEQIGWFL